MSGSPEVVTRRTVRPDYVTVRDAAVLTGRGESTIRRWIVDRRLTAVRDPGGGVLVPLAALNFPRMEAGANADRH